MQRSTKKCTSALSLCWNAQKNKLGSRGRLHIHGVDSVFRRTKWLKLF